jgi:hypothetical protein
MKNILIFILPILVFAEGPKCEKAMELCYNSLEKIEQSVDTKDFNLYKKERNRAKKYARQVAKFCVENEKLGKNIYQFFAAK